MHKIKDILRLSHEGRYSNRHIAMATGLPKSTICDYLKRAADAGLKWPLPDDLDEEMLENMLCKSGMKNLSLKPVPDFTTFPQELKRKGVTLQLLWMEYRETHPDGYEYSQFCELYGKWEKAHDIYMRQNYKAGEKMLIDFAGQTVPITNKETGLIWEAKLFIAILAASNYTFAMVVRSEKMEDWVRGHIAALEYFKGVAPIWVPDNLKSGVDKPCRYDPTINRTYLELAMHYGAVIIPARVRHPQDKSPVENAVKVATSWILAALRKITFFSIEDANAAVKDRLSYLNTKPFQKLPGSRKEQYEMLDKPALQTLRSDRFEYAEWETKKTVRRDYHVEIRGHYYSVPHDLVDKKIEARITQDIIEIIHKDKVIATHKRSFDVGKTTTKIEHMPKGHQALINWNWSTALEKAKAIGPNTTIFFERLYKESPHPNLTLKNCSGILKLHKEYGTDRLEAAAAKALQIGSYKFSSIRSILENRIDQKLQKQSNDEDPGLNHENIRGANYYR